MLARPNPRRLSRNEANETERVGSRNVTVLGTGDGGDSIRSIMAYLKPKRYHHGKNDTADHKSYVEADKIDSEGISAVSQQIQLRNSRSDVFGLEMGVSHGRLNVTVAEDVLDGTERDASHDEM